MADDPWDRASDRPDAQAHDDLAERSARAAASQRTRAQTDLNAAPARIERDTLGRYIYETAPVPIKRLFGSPLAQRGTWAKGPGGERQVSSGWGSPRSTAYDRNVNTNTKHHGLDFIAPGPKQLKQTFGEEVFACASGKVKFVGFQGKKGSSSVKGCTSNDDLEEIYNSKGEIVASKALGNIGFGGIFISIQHNNDFQGYATQYFHLSNTHVNSGDVVEEGQLIGNIGGTGGYYNWFHKGTHLHYQIEFVSGGLRAIVRPTAMVPNYWPGHADSTNSSQATDIILPLVASVGGQVAASRTAAMLSGINRATTIQNKGVSAVKTDQSNYANHVAQTIDMQRTSIYATAASFQGSPPVVTSPMSFDFDKGVWIVNGREGGTV